MGDNNDSVICDMAFTWDANVHVDRGFSKWNTEVTLGTHASACLKHLKNVSI